MRHNKPKILVAHDDSGIRGLMSLILGHRGFKMLAATTGPEAIDLFMKDHPSMVVLDLHMPGMNGLDTLERLHALNHRTPIIILS